MSSSITSGKHATLSEFLKLLQMNHLLTDDTLDECLKLFDDNIYSDVHLMDTYCVIIHSVKDISYIRAIVERTRDALETKFSDVEEGDKVPYAGKFDFK